MLRVLELGKQYSGWADRTVIQVAEASIAGSSSMNHRGGIGCNAFIREASQKRSEHLKKRARFFEALFFPQTNFFSLFSDEFRHVSSAHFPIWLEVDFLYLGFRVPEGRVSSLLFARQPSTCPKTHTTICSRVRAV